jgi:hypothetical protein
MAFADTLAIMVDMKALAEVEREADSLPALSSSDPAATLTTA